MSRLELLFHIKRRGATLNRSIEKLSEKFFNAFGFVVHKKGHPRTTMAEVLEHVSRLGFGPQAVIDVGVAYGTFELYQNFPEARTLLIRAIKRIYRNS